MSDSLQHIYIYVYCCCSVTKSYPTLLQPYELQSARPLHPWNFPGKNTGVSCHFLLQRLFPTQALNPWLSHQIFYLLTLQQHSLSKSGMKCSFLGSCSCLFTEILVSICFPGDSSPYTCENHRLIRFGAWGFVCLDARGPKRGVVFCLRLDFGFGFCAWKRERHSKFSYMKRRIMSLVTGNSGTIHECCFIWMTILFFWKGTFL